MRGAWVWACVLSLSLYSPIPAEDLISAVAPGAGAVNSGPIQAISIGEPATAQGAGPLAGLGFSHTIQPIDLKAPRTRLLLGQPSLSNAGMSIVSPLTVLGIASKDDLLFVDDDDGLGIQNQNLRLDGAARSIFVNPNPQRGQSFQSNFQLTDDPEGLRLLEFLAEDIKGHKETTQQATIGLDRSPPATTLSFGQPSFDLLGQKVIAPNALLTLSAQDPQVQGVAAGVQKTEYALDQGPAQQYAASFSVPLPGTHTLNYQSIDNLGHQESSKQAAFSVSPLELHALSAGLIRLKGRSLVQGSVAASTITVKGKAQIQGSTSIIPNLIPSDCLDLTQTLQTLALSNDNSLIPEDFLDRHSSILKIKKGRSLTLSTGTYHFFAIEQQEKSALIINGEVRILLKMAASGSSKKNRINIEEKASLSIQSGALLVYSQGSVHFHEKSQINAAGAPGALILLLDNSIQLPPSPSKKHDKDDDSDDEDSDDEDAAPRITLTHKGALAALVYGPRIKANLKGQSSLLGHLLAEEIKLSGQAKVISANFVPPAPLVALIQAAPLSLDPDPVFALREVFVFPNPALVSQEPVFHIETGMAQEGLIQIFDTSGEKVREITLSGPPQVLDRGQGPQYAWEEPLGAQLPSGVYLYSIQTRFNGAKLQKTGRFSIVR